MGETRTIGALDPKRPEGPPLKLTPSSNFLSIGKRGRVAIADFALYFKEVLLRPDHIFMGVTEDVPLLNPIPGDDDGLAYVKRLPMRHRESPQGALYQEAARGSEAFVVYVYGEGILAASRFEDCDAQGRPLKWESRFRELVYSAARFGPT
jgi:hypothetical protein